jgi:hypothetical protein
MEQIVHLLVECQMIGRSKLNVVVQGFPLLELKLLANCVQKFSMMPIAAVPTQLLSLALCVIQIWICGETKLTINLSDANNSL